MMRFRTSLLAAALLCLLPGLASAQIAALLPNGEQQFADQNGQPYASGSVYFYIPNTTTPKTTWVDPNETTPNANPVQLDAAGRAIIYGAGQYRQVLKDVFGNTVWDQLTQGGSTGTLGIYNITSSPYNASTSSSDNSAAINSAISDAATVSGQVYVPCGVFQITAQLTVPAGKNVNLVGGGQDCSVIDQTSGAANGISWGNAPNVLLSKGGGLSNITISAGAGNGNTNSTGVGITMQGVNDYFVLSNVGIRGFATGVALDYDWNTQWSNFTIRSASNAAMLIGCTGSYAVSAGNSFVNFQLDNNGGNAKGEGDGIKICQSGGIFFNTGDVTSFNNAVHIVPPSTEFAVYNFFNTVLADDSTNVGWLLDGTNGQITTTTCNACWAGFNGGPGIELTGSVGNIDGFRWVNGPIRENGTYGALLNAGVHVAIQDSPIASNGRGSTPGTYPGVQTNGGLYGLMLSNNTVANFSSVYSAQGSCFVFGTGLVDVIGQGNYCAPGNGAVAIVNNSTAASYSLILDDNYPNGVPAAGTNVHGGVANYPLNSGPVGLAPGNNLFMGLGASTTSEGQVAILSAGYGVVVLGECLLSAAPGTAQSQTCTIRKNLASPAGTPSCTISGTATFCFLEGNLAVVTGDALDMEITPSGGATSTFVSGYFQVNQ